MILGRLLWRGFTRRCPVCGQGQLFHRWFTIAERCPRCGLKFERIEGHSSGALGVNTVISLMVIFFAGVAGLVATFPELPLLPLTIMIVTVAAIFPIFFYPFSKTVWTAIDLRMRPPEAEEVSAGFADWIEPYDPR